MDVSTLSIILDPISNRKVINEKYRIIKKIGQGQFGKVLAGETVNNDKPGNDGNSQVIPNKYVAIKTINRIDKTRLITKAYLSQTTKIKREISIMKECNHPNVVKLYQVIDDLQFDKILLILEYCQFGEIDWKKYNHYYEKYQTHFNRKPLTLNKILRDVVNGLEYLHLCKNIIHRDLKPSNLLINSDNTIKISDFGVSLILENNANDAKELGKTMGTPAFFAPELCQFVHNRLSMITNENHKENKVIIDSRIDLWSVGVILYCLIFNDLPFNGFNEFELFKNIVRDELKFPKIKQSSKVTDVDIEEMKLLKDLIKKLLVKDPDQRISLNDIKNHEFTTFDLNGNEKIKFLNFNKAIFKDITKKEEIKQQEERNGMSDKNGDLGISSKIKGFFSSKPDISQPVPTSIDVETHTKNIEIDMLGHLEPVDDLLDSYLDDSSSLGSDDEVVEVDTTNLLESLNEADEVLLGSGLLKSNRYVAHQNSIEELKADPREYMVVPDLIDYKPSRESRERAISLTKEEFESDLKERESIISLKSSLSTSTYRTSRDSRQKPKPLILKHTSFISAKDSPSRKSSQNSFYNYRVTNTPSATNPSTPIDSINLSSPISVHGGSNPNTPTNNNSVTIGASSPSSFKSMKAIFSPSRRFFSRNKPKKEKKYEKEAETKPTIISLSSPAKKVTNKLGVEETKKKYTDLLEPPPIFGLNVAHPAPVKEVSKSSENNSQSSSLFTSPTSVFNDSVSRKNSVTSVNSTGYGLRRITSSSSSLNLNLYLTDDSYSLTSVKNIGSSGNSSAKYSLLNERSSLRDSEQRQDSDVRKYGEQRNYRDSSGSDGSFVIENSEHYDRGLQYGNTKEYEYEHKSFLGDSGHATDQSDDYEEFNETLILQDDAGGPRKNMHKYKNMHNYLDDLE